MVTLGALIGLSAYGIRLFSDAFLTIETPKQIHVKFHADDYFTTYPIHHQTLKEKLLLQKELWHYQYEFKIPTSVDSFLISQFMDGGKIYINNIKISELPHSNKANKYIWFRPHLVYIPDQLHPKTTKYSIVRIESASYLRYAYVMPVFAGKLLNVQILSDILFFLSRTLSVASSIVTLIAGGLLLATWFINKQDRLFLNASLAAITWACLYLLLNYPSIPADSVKFFRFVMYAFIAISVYNLTIYVVQLALESVPSLYKKTIFTTSVAGPVVYIISLGELQQLVDKVWIGTLFAITVPAFYQLFKKLLKGGMKNNRMLGVVLILAFFAAYRDFQFIGFERLILETRSTTTWDLIDAPMLISYIVVPLVFAFSASRLLQNYQISLQTINQHNTTLKIALEKKEMQLRIAYLEDLRKKQRDIQEITRSSIHRDLHDGIGSRLVATVYALRSGRLTRTRLEDSLIHCLKDIRAIMQTESEQEVRSLQIILFEYCSEMEEILEGTNVKLSYSIPPDREISLLGNRATELLKMIQELLSNALKHSNACEIFVDMQLSDSYLTLKVTEEVFSHDMSHESRNAPQVPSSNTGLKSLELRAQSMGATFLQQVSHTSRTSYIALRLFVDRVVYLSDSLPKDREARRHFLSSQISELT